MHCVRISPTELPLCNAPLLVGMLLVKRAWNLSGGEKSGYRYIVNWCYKKSMRQMLFLSVSLTFKALLPSRVCSPFIYIFVLVCALYSVLFHYAQKNHTSNTPKWTNSSTFEKKNKKSSWPEPVNTVNTTNTTTNISLRNIFFPCLLRPTHRNIHLSSFRKSFRLLHSTPICPHTIKSNPFLVH